MKISVLTSVGSLCTHATVSSPFVASSATTALIYAIHRCTPPSLSAIKLVKNHTSVPVLANGDVFSLSDVHKIIEETGVDGVMAARGLLENPALFAGYTSTPTEAVTNFMNNAMRCPLPHKLLLHHLSEMTGTLLTKKERAKMMDCRDTIALIDWLDENIGIQRPI
ncbi:hypothetical protein B0A49_03985 [Cryomyces minteri]|uniref:DUS-like FMN-binding domain-containing protein n=1 Tax=Cryomyces minteri TaxID=331657 RepID=A0A4U0X489_9PEZI|nr:hypothetical protein B0A49_03985 [Cryomyces minteri]